MSKRRPPVQVEGRADSVAEWLKTHTVTKLKAGFALGISTAERITGVMANPAPNYRSNKWLFTPGKQG